MESRKIILISILIGFLGMMFSFLYLRQKEQTLLKGMNLVNVLVAAQDIPMKTKLTQDLFKVQEIPERYLEPKSLMINDASDYQKVLGMVNLVPIFAGQQIMLSQIVPPSAETGLSVNVPIGNRAVIVQVSNIDVVDLIKPNDHVDILTTFSAKTKGGGTIKMAATVLQNVLVVGVGKELGQVIPGLQGKNKTDDTEQPSSGVMTISVAASPAEVQLIALAEAQGDVIFTVRASEDHETQALKAVDSTIFLK